MCIIAVKKAGIEMPDSKVMDEMFWNNNDGAGFMFVSDGMVHIRKGYMKFLDFEKAITEVDEEIGLKDKPLIMHFRIGTHGKNVPENTHPFPVSENLHALQKTRLRTDWALHTTASSMARTRRRVFRHDGIYQNADGAD
jgi:hypothetical protein